MKKICTLMLLGLATAGAAQAQYQLPNPGFEEWETVKYDKKSGEEPVKWNSFLDGTGSLKNMAGYNQLEKSTERRNGATGSYSAKLTSRAVKMLGVTIAIAQGNITTGCINMGSTTATDAKGNYNYLNSERDDQNPTFTGRPDAVKFWVKFKGSKTGNASVFLVTDGYYQDPDEGGNAVSATKIAHAKNGNIASNDTWTEITVPFTYYVDGAPTHVLASFSTCATPGAGKEADYMYLDDIVMVYNSELESASYNGATVSFSGTAATVDAEYNENLLVLASNGHGATIEKSYNDATALLTITVKGDNISEDANNFHTYTIQFATPKATATMSIGDAGYATFVAPFDVALPAGISAYVLTGITSNGMLEKTSVSDIARKPSPRATIPANTPVVLESSSSSTNVVEGVAIDIDGAPTYGLLTGVYKETAAPIGSLVLQKQGDRVGFYVVEDVQPTILPNRCYLTLPAGSNARALYFDDDLTTALNAAVITSHNTSTTFDLQGRRVNNATQKGILIVNGKKVIK